MTYRDLGNDVRATTGSTRTVAGPMGITATATGSTVTFYTRDPRGSILNSHDTTGVRNYVTEFNGSVAALYNPSGTAVGSYKYSPYGATTVAAETGGTTAATNPFRYIGGYQDKTNSGADGNYKLGARYYDTHGHFTQPDSIQGTINNPKTLTAYNYASGDPINNSDPSGRCTAPSDPAGSDGDASCGSGVGEFNLGARCFFSVLGVAATVYGGIELRVAVGIFARVRGTAFVLSGSVYVFERLGNACFK